MQTYATGSGSIKDINNMPRTKEEILQEFSKIMFESDLSDGEAKYTENKIRVLFDEYAQARFDAAIGDEKSSWTHPNESSIEHEQWNDCRQTIIDNWNAQSKE
jgi:hypothetical protein